MEPNGSAVHAFCWLHGNPKRAKTSGLLACFPGALFIGVKSAIQAVAEGEYGFTPAVLDQNVETFDQLWPVLEQVAPVAAEYGAVVFDDATLIAQRSVTVWKEQAPVGRSGKPDGFWPYQQLSSALGELAAWGRYLGVHVGVSSHQRPSGYDDKGTFTPAGPDLGSKSGVSRMPGWCDVMAAADLWPDSPDPWLPIRFKVNPFDKDVVTGDRNGVCWENTPPRLREILLGGRTPYHLPRLPGMEWLDDVASEVCARLDQGLSPLGIFAALAQEYDSWLSEDRFKHERHLRWGIQDGLARWQIRRRTAQGLFAPDRLAPPVVVAAASGIPKPPGPPPPPPPKDEK